ncbi:DNA methyltransferase [Thermomonas alba]|uniref:DNA methyltransferase n=1 Tax=Thermomonas alba TaxID=2888525 RepID=UPI001F050065
MHHFWVFLQRYRSEVKFIYIDPPYNTGSDGFAYKDAYQHSTWLSALDDRLALSMRLLSNAGIYAVSIGEDEFEKLAYLMKASSLRTVVPFVWKSRAKPTNAGEARLKPQLSAEFVLFGMLTATTTFYPLTSGHSRKYPHSDELGSFRVTSILTSNLGRYRRETMRFDVAGYTPPDDKRWKAGQEEILDLLKRKRLAFNNEGEPYAKVYEHDEEELHIPLWTFMPEDVTGTAESGKADLGRIVGATHGIDSVKPKELLAVFLEATTREGLNNPP